MKEGGKLVTRARIEPGGTCFVIIPFAEPFNSYYSKLIAPVVKDARFECVRGDSLFRPSPIMADVWGMIQGATFLIAVLTGQNSNVFYELGLAHAVGKPAILVTETMVDVPFDLQALRVILYDKNDPSWGKILQANIKAAIRAIISDPVSTVPEMFRASWKGAGVADDVPAQTDVRAASDADSLLFALQTGHDLYTDARLLVASYKQGFREHLFNSLTIAKPVLSPRKRSLLFAFLLYQEHDLNRNTLLEQFLVSLGSPNTVELLRFFGASKHLIDFLIARMGKIREANFVQAPPSRLMIGTSPSEINSLPGVEGLPRAWADAESPKHEVSVDAFRICVFATTNHEYALFDGLHTFSPTEDNHPATGMTWRKAREYAEWWGGRLPTEAEWLVAAASDDGRSFPWGNDYRPDLCNCEDTKIGHTIPVNAFPEGKSPLGCFQMSGNIWEFTSSAFRPFPYNANDGRENALLQEYRVIKGGSYSSKVFNLRCNTRDYRFMDSPNSKVGFRMAMMCDKVG